MWKSLGPTCAAMAACVVLAAGCSSQNETTPTPIHDGSTRLDENHSLGEPVTVENLTVWPVYTDAPLEVGEFLTLNEAQERELAVVRELGAELDEYLASHARGEADSRVQVPPLRLSAQAGATVGTLEIENSGALPILVCAGTVLKGGNQDRQIAQDFVVPAKSRVPVDAFCVERGRWTALRRGQPTGGKFLMARAMAPTPVRAMGQYERNQHRVWQEVAEVVHGRTASPMGTSLALSIDDADDAARDVDERLAAPVRAHFSERFASERAVVGFAYAIDGKPVTVRTFAHTRILEDHLDAFVDTMCMEAEIAQRRATRSMLGTPTASRDASADDVVRLVQELEGYREEIRETNAANRNGYRKGEVGFQSSCYVDHGSEQVAVTQDWTAR